MEKNPSIKKFEVYKSIKPKPHCEKKIKYGFTKSKSSYFDSVIKDLEKQANHPEELKKSVLKDMYSVSFLDELQNIINLEPNSVASGSDLDENIKETVSNETCKRIFSDTESTDDDDDDENRIKKFKTSNELERLNSTENLLLKVFNIQPKIKYTPYKNFFKKSSIDARSWVKICTIKPPKSVKKKAEEKVRRIAESFYNWLNESGYKHNLTPQHIVDMFDYSQELSKIVVKQSELPTLPVQFAKQIGKIKISKPWQTAKSIAMDRTAFETPPPYNYAFGKKLPHDICRGKSLNEDYKIWLHQHVPRELESMEKVFSEILDLTITKQFALFMSKSYSRTKPPDYLVKHGFLKEAERKTSRNASRLLSESSIKNKNKIA